jgi:hypothetical protein
VVSSLFPPPSFRIGGAGTTADQVFEPAGTAVALQRYTEAVRPDRHPE